MGGLLAEYVLAFELCLVELIVDVGSHISVLPDVVIIHEVLGVVVISTEINGDVWRLFLLLVFHFELNSIIKYI